MWCTLKTVKLQDLPAELFYALPAERISQMGLRTLTMECHNCAKTFLESADKMELRDFSFSYDTEPILQIPSLTLPQGAVIAVIGNNGAGKSTFTHCLCGLEKQFKGFAVTENASPQRAFERKLHGHARCKPSAVL